MAVVALSLHPTPDMAVVDAIFIADIGINFFSPYREPPSRGGLWVQHNRRIVIHYLKTWFILDTISSIPYDIIMLAVAAAMPDVAASNSSGLRAIKMLRLVKLVRTLSALPRTLSALPHAPSGLRAMLRLVKLARRPSARALDPRAPRPSTPRTLSALPRTLSTLDPSHPQVRILRASRIFRRWEAFIG